MPATAIARPGRWRPVLVIVGALLLALVLFVAIDLLVITGRFQRYDVTMPGTDGPKTWVIVGLDDREDVDEAITGQAGPPESQPGTRADAIIVVTQMPDAVRGLSIPRNLVIKPPSGQLAEGRLAVVWRDSPQAFVDVLCQQLSIPTDHLITIDLQAFVDIVDALDGIEIDVPAPLRDEHTQLDLSPGRQQLDGLTALGYVRSRQGQTMVDGQWVAEPHGEQARQERQAAVVAAILAKARTNPASLQTAAWRASPHIGLDDGSSLLDLVDLKYLTNLQVLPTQIISEGKLNRLDFTSERAVAERGYASNCDT